MSGIMLGTWRLCYLSVLPVARLQNPSCWDSHFTPDVCCNLAFGPHGNAECWDGVHTFEFCCGSSAAVPTAREPASPECWSAGYSEGDCCDLLHGPHGNPACWSGGQEHGYTFAKCCASHEAGQVATFGEQGPPAAPRFGADCWHGLWESFFFCCEPASGFQFCKISPSKYDRCCNGLYRAPPIWFHVSKDEPMARCWLHLVHDQYHLNLQSPRECHKANSQQYYVSAVLLRKMLVNFSHKPWWARPRGEHYSDAENRESEPQLPIHWMYMGSVCVPSVCDEDMVAGWFAVKLDPIGDHKIAQGRAINSTHLEVPPLVAIRRPYVHFDRAWIAIRSSANRHFIDTEYCEFTMFKYNAAWSLSLSQGHRKIICTWVIIVMFASVCHFLPFSRYLGFLAPQRSVLQLYRRHGAIWLDVVRVLLCIKVGDIVESTHKVHYGDQFRKSIPKGSQGLVIQVLKKFDGRPKGAMVKFEHTYVGLYDCQAPKCFMSIFTSPRCDKFFRKVGEDMQAVSAEPAQAMAPMTNTMLNVLHGQAQGSPTPTPFPQAPEFASSLESDLATSLDLVKKLGSDKAKLQVLLNAVLDAMRA